MPTLYSKKAFDFLDAAKKQMSIAENMYNYTSSVSDNFKVYLSCLMHIRESLILTVNSLLEHENYFKKIMFIPENQKLQLKMFIDEFNSDLRLSLIDKKNIKELNYVYEIYKSRETGMKRGDSYLVISSNFEMVSLNKEQMRNYFSTVKSIISKSEDWLKKQN